MDTLLNLLAVAMLVMGVGNSQQLVAVDPYAQSVQVSVHSQLPAKVTVNGVNVPCVWSEEKVRYDCDTMRQSPGSYFLWVDISTEGEWWAVVYQYIYPEVLHIPSVLR